MILFTRILFSILLINSLQHKQENFYTFLNKFMSDSTFQKSRIQFPLLKVIETSDGFKVELIERDDWVYDPIYSLTARKEVKFFIILI